ncbi:hypothetical protein [Methylococcus sp. EFPC2]|uniref:hypothetical protein n=1 Tax=Methylococcus sp. EFPC2 TaxID=2812648 RepID=UPI001966F34E|nr:hypothetical protein [Methylococcus sp. EFPC2]QSA98861.1 hypothetical protein JWZ97_08845 [Methylococcus sp. EFPC2]
MPKRIVPLFLALIVLSGLSACAKKFQPGQLASGIDVGSTYYTQFSLFQEKNNYRTTNYRRGFLIPVNTAVTLTSINSKEITLRLSDSGQPLTIENVPKHTNEDVQAAFLKILGPRKVDLSRFSADEQKAILDGQVKIGMSRKAVQVAIGYPPQNSTPNLSVDDWTYWASRFDRFIVHFKNDKVAEIRH